jgi:hypothetical protein
MDTFQKYYFGTLRTGILISAVFGIGITVLTPEKTSQDKYDICLENNHFKRVVYKSPVLDNCERFLRGKGLELKLSN